MNSVYDDKIEEVIASKLHEHQAAKIAAERKLEAAHKEMIDAEQAVEHWMFALEDYRRSHGLPPHPPSPSPVLEAEYSHMGPTELVQHWAEKHGGEVVVKELAKVAFNAGVSSSYRLASSAIYAILKRKNYVKVAPGHFKKPDYDNDQEAPIVVPSSRSNW
ncbi:MAG: hypothetical protein OXI91_03420 [Chloroflexota bacterium]|nr:hypothetical protein [Chloroflexota bacterium]